jgi:subtilisin family serine protease
MVIVVAAGNDGAETGKPYNLVMENGTTVSVMDGPASFIGLKNMIVVGSIDKDGSASTFSNWSGKYVQIAAPGRSILSTLPPTKPGESSFFDPNYGYMSGTSMSAPFVTGAVALLASKGNTNKALSATDLKRILLNTANASIGRGALSAYGLLDVKKALELDASSASALPPTVPAIGLSLKAPSWTYAGETFYAAAEIEPWDSTATVAWSSSNTNIATVDSSGLVRANSAGRVTISAVAGGISGSATVEVRNRQTGGTDDGGVDGCNAGFPAFAVILALSFFIMRKYANKA